MVAQPTALWWVGVFKNRFENKVCMKTLLYEEYKLVIWKIWKTSTKSFKQGIKQNYISWKKHVNHMIINTQNP